jgi:hypothetical protein
MATYHSVPQLSPCLDPKCKARNKRSSLFWLQKKKRFITLSTGRMLESKANGGLAGNKIGCFEIEKIFLYYFHKNL